LQNGDALNFVHFFWTTLYRYFVSWQSIAIGDWRKHVHTSVVAKIFVDLVADLETEERLLLLLTWWNTVTYLRVYVFGLRNTHTTLIFSEARIHELHFVRLLCRSFTYST